MLKLDPLATGAKEVTINLGDGALGIHRLMAAGHECWSHRGFLGTIVRSCPDIGLTVVAPTNVGLSGPLPLATDLLSAATA